jgi:hypothetical protein
MGGWMDGNKGSLDGIYDREECFGNRISGITDGSRLRNVEDTFS